jgi:Protein of unknown function (DUF3307)
VSWASALLAFLVSHLAGDLLLQTDWQALNKVRGLADPLGRRALGWHVTTYMIAFVPALVWIGHNTSAGRALAVGVLIAVPHVLIDDGHFVRAWLRCVKHAADPEPGLSIAVDQSFHVVCLLGAALVSAS